MSISIALDTKNVEPLLTRVMRGASDFGDISPEIAQLLENSVRRNFREGGRPVKWPSSKRADEQAAYGNPSGQTLVDTARLMNSIVGEGFRDKVVVGTNVDYAAAHNFGIDEQITQQVRQHVRRISQAFGKPIAAKEVTVAAHSREVHMELPQREFMLIQDEDWDDIEDVVTAKINRLIEGE